MKSLLNSFPWFALCLFAMARSSVAFLIRPGRTQRRMVPPPTWTWTSSSSSSSLETNEIIVEPNLLEPSLATSATNWRSDGFVFGLEGSGLERPKGKQAITVVDGDSLETKPYQVALVSLTFVVQAVALAWAISTLLFECNGGDVPLTILQTMSLISTSYVLADFGSGVLHWSVDNYGNGNTPIMGGIIAAFQGHHAAPWTICQRGFCNNVYKLCLPFGIVPTLLVSMLAPPTVAIFAISFCVFEILSQEFHKWSHQTKGEAPMLANALQNVGFTVPRTQHALHHVAPYDGNYCIISGICNKPLDESGVFRWMEHIIYQWNGVESNAWKLDGELRTRTLAGDYRLLKTTTK